MPKDDYVTKQRFCKNQYVQPYFVWHSLRHYQGVGADLLDHDGEMHEIELDDWDEDYIEVLPRELGRRFVATMRRIDEWLEKHLSETFDAIVIGEKNLEARIARTRELLSSGKLLINPAFVSGQSIAEPFAYDTKTHAIINRKYAMKVKRRDFLEASYDYQVISASAPVAHYYLFLPRERVYDRFEIKLEPTSWGSTTLNGKRPNRVKDETETSFMDAVTANQLQLGRSKVPEMVPFPSVAAQEAAIMAAKNVTAPTPDVSDDAGNVWGTNPEWNLLLKLIGSPYANYSGNLYRKAKIKNAPMILARDSKLAETLYNLKTPLVNRDALEPFYKIKAAQRAVWFDFEGYALPFAPLKHTYPFQQVVFQVSVIVTENDVEQHTENIVLDPLTLVPSDFIKIIRAIYDPAAAVYVVYNKTYESARLNEMAQILAAANDPTYEEFSTKLAAMSDKWVDLFDLFRISSGKTVPPILLPGQQARASIKNIEAYISQHRVPVPRPIKVYKQLTVQNGTMAMEYAIDRALGITGPTVWNQQKIALAEYCENDVRAMIMAYDYVNMLVQN